MNYDFPAVVIHFDKRITPTEFRVQVIEADRHLEGRNCSKIQCWVHEKHGKAS